MKIADKEFLAEIDAKAEALKQKIINSKTDVIYTGTAYYVSPNGDDMNDGLSPETAIQTLERIHTLPLAFGDAIFLERGSTWRGNISINISGITISAYGEGKKPVINVSLKNYAVPHEWVKTDVPNVWKYMYPFGVDVGHIVFDGEYHGYKRCLGHYGFTEKLEELQHDLEFYSDRHNNEFLYVYSEENPGTRFKSIEIERKICGILVRSKSVIHIDNICVLNAFFGVSSGSIKNFHVTNCIFGVIGGAGSAKKDGTDFVRLGNGVEMYGLCTNFSVENCWFYDVYDAGVTHQRSGPCDVPVIMENVTYKDNLFERCIYSIEYFCDQKDNTEACMKHIRMSGNICRYAGGFGWQRPNRVARHIQGGWLHSKRMYPSEDFIVENNIFDRSINTLISCSALDEKHLPVMRGNTYIQYKDGYYGLCGVPYDHYEKFDDDIENYIMNQLGEKDAVIAVVTEDDGLCKVKPDPDEYYTTLEGYIL